MSKELIAKNLKEALGFYMDDPTADVICQKTIIKSQDCSCIEDAMGFYEGVRPKPLLSPGILPLVMFKCDKCGGDKLEFNYESSNGDIDNTYINKDGDIIHYEGAVAPTIEDIRDDFITAKNMTDVKFFCDTCEEHVLGTAEINGVVDNDPRAALVAFLELTKT